MSINFPSSLDTLVNPSSSAGDTLLSVPHDTQHANANDAIEALEAKVGVDSSAVTTSLDYLLKNTSSSDPGHKHTLATGATDVTASAAEVNILDGITATTTELNYTNGVTSAIQTQLDAKVDENAAITGATKTKITYDAKGLVTAGADATTADIAASTNKNYVTDAQAVVIGNTSGTNTGDQDLSSYAPLSNPTFTTAIATPIIRPSADGTTAIQITKADGATAVMKVDTTNSRIGIGPVSATVPLEVSLSNTTKTTLVRADNSNTTSGATAAITLTTDEGEGQRTRGEIVSGVDGSNSGFISLWTRNSGTSAERLRVSAAGNVTITGTVGASNLSGTNTGDQTLPVKATGAEVDTGTDDAKFVTAKAVTDSGIVQPAKTQTLTNKRITKREVTATSYTTSTTIASDSVDIYTITAQAGALLFNNPSGTPTQGQTLIIRIKDNGTARALTYGTEFRAMGVSLPSTTVLSKTLYMLFMRNTTDTKWDLLASNQEA